MQSQIVNETFTGIDVFLAPNVYKHMTYVPSPVPSKSNCDPISRLGILATSFPPFQLTSRLSSGPCDWTRWYWSSILSRGCDMHHFRAEQSANFDLSRQLEPTWRSSAFLFPACPPTVLGAACVTCVSIQEQLGPPGRLPVLPMQLVAETPGPGSL